MFRGSGRGEEKAGGEAREISGRPISGRPTRPVASIGLGPVACSFTNYHTSKSGAEADPHELRIDTTPAAVKEKTRWTPLRFSVQVASELKPPFGSLVGLGLPVAFTVIFVRSATAERACGRYLLSCLLLRPICISTRCEYPQY